ncbi:MAG TPA: hypothetical protein VGF92_02270 [Stellaceae bacterium]|jgi:carboxyvinyl-carboxyphosphonate phosphorylmutase
MHWAGRREKFRAVQAPRLAASSKRSLKQSRFLLVLGGLPAELRDLDYLGAQRVRFYIRDYLPVAAAIRAAYETLKALCEGARPRMWPGIAGPELTKQATRRWMKDFLGG